MAQINFRIDDGIKAEAETLFNSLGMNTTTALMIFIRQALSERAIPFAIRQVTPTEYSSELTSRIEDLNAGRNCHVHELIDADGHEMAKATSKSASRRSSVTRRRTHAKAMA